MIFCVKDLIVVKKQFRLNRSIGWQEVTTHNPSDDTSYDLFPNDKLHFSHFYISKVAKENLGTGLNFEFVDSVKTDGPEFLLPEFERFLQDGTLVIVKEEN